MKMTDRKCWKLWFSLVGGEFQPARVPSEKEIFGLFIWHSSVKSGVIKCSQQDIWSQLLSAKNSVTFMGMLTASIPVVLWTRWLQVCVRQQWDWFSQNLVIIGPFAITIKISIGGQFQPTFPWACPTVLGTRSLLQRMPVSRAGVQLSLPWYFLIFSKVTR